MPRIHTTREKVNNHFYYIYNCSSRNRLLFQEERDYLFFENLLSAKCSPRCGSRRCGEDAELPPRELELHAYSIWPQCFQLLFYAHTVSSLPSFMRSLSTSYSMYYNRRHSSSGSPFYSKYRSVLLSTNVQIIKTFRYLHVRISDCSKWPHSSYSDYFIAPRPWISTHAIPKLLSRKYDLVDFMCNRDALGSDLLSSRQPFSNLESHLMSSLTY